MKLLKTLSIPMMMYRTKRKNQVCTINNWSSIHHHAKTKIKNKYKDLLKSWFLDGDKLPEDLHFDVLPVYKDRRRRDTINIAPSLKVFEDCLVELECIKDDDNTSFHLRTKQVDKDLAEHILKIKIYKRGE